MASLRNYSAFGISALLHVIVMMGLLLVKYKLVDDAPQLAIESIVTDERVQDEFTKDLQVTTDVAETFNTVAGGVVSTAIGSAAPGPVANKTKIETSESLKEPEIKVNAGDITMPGDSMVGVDLGEGQVSGEVGAFVEGYGAALGQMTQELIRLMREQKVMVVWLFDESESMKDDQKEIRDKFHEVYEELGVVTKKDDALKKRGGDVLLTSIVAFGKEIHPLTPKPTSDVNEIRAAIDKIPIDNTGVENLFATISATISEYRTQAARQKRKLVLVVVSDEAGDDGDKVEPTLDLAKKANAPIYFLGREAIFGYPYARIRWKDPKYGLTHWLRIRRGPETPYREALQWDGLHARWDAFSSGFGPYEQVRLAKETGGVFFVLPSEEENLSGAGARDQRRFDALDMKEYEPLLSSRRDYEQEVLQSKFRTMISKIIADLDPEKVKQLNIRENWYPLEVAKFRAQAAEEVVKAQRAMTGLSQVIPALESVKPLRDKESSQRWRANYDLALAQVYAYRIRLFQYLLAMDNHANNMPKPKSPTSNVWNVGRTPKKWIDPDEAQFDRLKKAFSLKTTREEYLADLKEQKAEARQLFEFVINEHPRTPWAKRASYELNTLGFGMHFYDTFRDPNYDKPDIKLPNF